MSENPTPHIAKVGKSARVIHTDAGVYAITSTPTDTLTTMSSLFSQKVDWEADPTMVLGKKLVPYGTNNNLPDVIRDIMDDNNLAPGIIEREIGLLYGNGPQLYTITADGGQINRQYIQHPGVQAWLDTWDYKRYIDMAIVEFKYLKGIFVKRTLNRGPRIGRAARITDLQVIPGTDARLEWPDSGYKRLESVRNIYIGDFTNNCLQTGITRYPVHDPTDPFRHPVSVGYHNKYSFGRSFYSVPSFYGTLKWIMRSSDIPDVLAHLSENGITSAFHIHSPSGYWVEKMDKIQKMYPEKPEAYHLQKLDEVKDELFSGIAKTLTGKKNAGKYIETVDFYDQDNNLCQWKVESIDQKVKDFIEAQLKISEKADSATTSGLGLHPSLSNIIVNGQLSSGSQMLYALKLYMASDTSIPEEVIFQPINQAIAANFPGTDIRMGFYHQVVMKEEQVAPEDRVTTNAEKK